MADGIQRPRIAPWGQTPTYFQRPGPAVPSYTPPPQALAVDPNGKPVAAAPPAPPPEIRDSAFNAGIASLLGQVQRQRASTDEQGRQSDQDYQTNLSRLAEQRARALTSTNETANQQGLFESGQLGKRRGQVNEGYDQTVGDQTLAHERSAAARAAALNDIGTLRADASSPYGYSATGNAQNALYGLLNDAAGRYAAAHYNDPAPVPPPPAPPASPPVPAAAPAPLRPRIPRGATAYGRRMHPIQPRRR
jgi:hypothetical protein